MKKRILGTLTIAALVAAVVAGISYTRNKLRNPEKSDWQDDYFDHISPRL